MNGTPNIPFPVNEPVLTHAPGTPERATLKSALALMSS
jgi:1-pyrroline-5-carboxylate dehydrogenase